MIEDSQEELDGTRRRRPISRARDAYRSWRSDVLVQPVAPWADPGTDDGANDEAVLALLKEHDPLGSSASPVEGAILGIDPDALVLAEVLVAASIQTQASEDFEQSAGRMEIAMLTRVSEIRHQVGKRDFNYEKVLAGLTREWSDAQRMLLILSLIHI